MSGPIDRAGTTTRGSTPGRPDASMSLLTQLMTDTLDPGYAAASQRRAAGEPPRQHRWVLLAGVVVVGLLLAVAAEQTRDRAGAASAVRVELTEEIERRTSTLDQLQSEVDSLRAAVAAAREEALALESGDALAQRLASLEAVTGLAPVSGSGVEVVVDDAPEVDGGTDDPRADVAADEAEGRILDYDLQRLVNGLWTAGAEAVAVNGRRLTSLSAIRAAGRAILVDYRPLSPPYVVQAIGDPDQLEARFAESPGGRYMETLEGSYGVRFDVSSADDLRLPGASAGTLREAQVPPSAAPSDQVPSSAATEEGR